MRWTTTSFVMPLRPFTRPREQMDTQWMDFHEIWYLKIFFENVYRKFKFDLYLRRITSTLHEDPCKLLVTWRWILLRMRNISDEICRENQNTRVRFHNFVPRKSCHLLENVWKTWSKQTDHEDNIIRCMTFACCITKGTNTHSECLLFLLRQNCLGKHDSLLRYSDIACLVLDQIWV